MAKEQNKQLTTWQKFVEWLKDLFYEEYEVTIWFHKETLETERGLKVDDFTEPKVFRFETIKKLTPTHLKGVDIEGNIVEIRTQKPFNYNVKKIH